MELSVWADPLQSDKVLFSCLQGAKWRVKTKTLHPKGTVIAISCSANQNNCHFFPVDTSEMQRMPDKNTNMRIAFLFLGFDYEQRKGS
ncbi:hypothetical protein XELAEV_18004828mg [Xenopus laevis]|uniref:Uncharacterized protein n=1 Tax=Xenopus laevis TaxID=8355 RepID=A0A974DW47_XENLA|nr:hypothetical protein XELAEV_18004828mg [Xenopus laevis]